MKCKYFSIQSKMILIVLMMSFNVSKSQIIYNLFNSTTELLPEMSNEFNYNLEKYDSLTEVFIKEHGINAIINRDTIFGNLPYEEVEYNRVIESIDNWYLNGENFTPVIYKNIHYKYGVNSFFTYNNNFFADGDCYFEGKLIEFQDGYPIGENLLIPLSLSNGSFYRRSFQTFYRSTKINVNPFITGSFPINKILNGTFIICSEIHKESYDEFVNENNRDYKDNILKLKEVFNSNIEIEYVKQIVDKYSINTILYIENNNIKEIITKDEEFDGTFYFQLSIENGNISSYKSLNTNNFELVNNINFLNSNKPQLIKGELSLDYTNKINKLIQTQGESGGSGYRKERIYTPSENRWKIDLTNRFQMEQLSDLNKLFDNFFYYFPRIDENINRPYKSLDKEATWWGNGSY